MEGLIGIVGTLLGTILGWLLNNLSESLGKIIINIDNMWVDVKSGPDGEYLGYDEEGHPKFKDTGTKPESIWIELNLSILNNKKIRSGIHNCELYLETPNGYKASFMNKIISYEDDINELENVMNMDSRILKKIHIHQTTSLMGNSKDMSQGYKIYLKYIVNGEKRIRKKLIYSGKYVQPTVNK